MIMTGLWKVLWLINFDIFVESVCRVATKPGILEKHEIWKFRLLRPGIWEIL